MSNSVFKPLFFEPISREMIWGGKSLKDCFGRVADFDKIGESWDISCHAKARSIVSEGEYKGVYLDKLVADFPCQILGSKLSDRKTFPLLVKLIDAAQDLSVQVHPNDTYARILDGESQGKTEMWHIIDAGEDSEIVYGLKSGVRREEFKEAMKSNDIERFLNKVRVNPGDTIFIPAGLVHAIGKNILLFETQQSSDLTYRVYDYNRLDSFGKARELHLDKAMTVIDFSEANSNYAVKGVDIKEEGGHRHYLISTDYFVIEKLVCTTIMKDDTLKERFHALTVVKGKGEIISEKFNANIKAGDSMLIPAALGKYELKGDFTVIKSYIPGSKEDIVNYLINKGFNRTDIIEFIAGIA